MTTKPIIPIVFSTNDDYAPYLGVALQSLIDHASDENEYHIYVLYTRMTEVNIHRLSAMATDNVSIDFKNISSYVKDIPFQTSSIAAWRHVTIETYYKMFIPAIIKQYPKVLYLDCDLVILRDIADLYSVDLGGKPVGAAYSAIHWVTPNTGSKGDVEDEELLNSGVLVFDVCTYEKQHIIEQTIELLKSGEKFEMCEQEVMRKVLLGKVAWLNNHWNFPWHFLLSENSSMTGVTLKAYEQVKKEPYILHFTSPIKPWNRPSGEMAEYFWKYARQTVYYEEIIYKNTVVEQKDDNYIYEYLFPFDLVQRGSNIALYAAGQVGQSFYNQIKTTNYCNCVLWTDANFEFMIKRGLPVAPINDLLNTAFDTLIIAVKEQKTASSIKETLISKGIPKEKIIWENPVKESTA